MRKSTISGARVELGAVAVEFALVATLFFTVLTGIIAVAHWMYTLEMLSEATRAGARIAAVCDLNDAAIKAAVQKRVPQLALIPASPGQTCATNQPNTALSDQIVVEYLPTGCTIATCESVRVCVTGATYTTLSGFIPGNPLQIPAVATQFPRESMESLITYPPWLPALLNPTCL